MKRDMVNFGRGIAVLGTLAALCAGPGTALAAGSRVTLANGLAVTLYDAGYLASRLTTLDGEAAIRLDDGRFVPVITDIHDPAIMNRGDGTFHAFPGGLVLSALTAIQPPAPRLPVNVYVLPYPRRNVLVSSTIGADIFLSPHVLDVDPSVVDYIVSHELGHVFHNRFMPDGGRAWAEYRRLRGIDGDVRYSDRAPHAYRPREVFAEDFRVLFGAPRARLEGRIENPELASPEGVPGLADFYFRVGGAAVAAAPALVATSHPNPFNPSTEIRVSMPSDLVDRGTPVTVRVYSVKGERIKDLYSGRAPGDFVVSWDGTDRAGNPVASATYYAAVQAGDRKETVKLVLLK
jgi:hypothetical protein